MDVVILCGGKGTRLSEETTKRPKPMVEVGGMPILWHIMKTYSNYGYNRFILALGYKGNSIKQYFYNYKISSSDFSLSLDPNSKIKYLNSSKEKKWEIIFVNTGEETLKGGRIKKIEKYINTDNFHLTYGDGVSDVNISKLAKFHKNHGCIGTVTAVRPPSRFGELNIGQDNTVLDLEEKPQMGKGLINGGYFIFDKKILSYLEDKKDCDFEFGPLQKISRMKQLKAFEHNGFWQCMDNIREKYYLEEQIRNKTAPWVVWE
tara:strand:- start:20282 stop:21064 length:783 start_codon:yes stop_codon:yes gene_type:complete